MSELLEFFEPDQLMLEYGGTSEFQPLYPN
jgi:hypothetical protein